MDRGCGLRGWLDAGKFGHGYWVEYHFKPTAGRYVRVVSEISQPLFPIGIERTSESVAYVARSLTPVGGVGRPSCKSPFANTRGSRTSGRIPRIVRFVI